MFPFLFNMYMDELIERIKEKIPNVEVICFADDLVIAGKIDINILSTVFDEFNLVLNEKKSVTFVKKIGQIPKRAKVKYLGYHINDKGALKGITAYRKMCREKAKTLEKFFGRFNSLKSWRLLNAIVKSRWDYFSKGNPDQTSAEKIENEWIKNMKLALRLPGSLPIEVMKVLIAKIAKEKYTKNQFSTLVKFMRSHDKIDACGLVREVTENMVSRLSLKEMERLTVNGISKYTQIKNEIKENDDNTKKLSLIGKNNRTKDERDKKTKKEKTSEAPWGYKKNGEPKMRPGNRTKAERRQKSSQLSVEYRGTNNPVI